MKGSYITLPPPLHPQLNQIFAGGGDRGAGTTRVLYDPAVSEKGALACVTRAARTADPSDFRVVAPPVILTPHALPAFRDDPNMGKKRRRADATLKPEKAPGAKKGLPAGRAPTGHCLLTQHVVQDMVGASWKNEDMREVMLSHAAAAAGPGPSYISSAYADTQPVTIFGKSEEQERSELEEHRRKILGVTIDRPKPS